MKKRQKKYVPAHGDHASTGYKEQRASFWGRFLSSASRFSQQKFTIMFIPHADKKVVNFHIHAIPLSFSILALLFLLIIFFYLATVYTGTGQENAEKQVVIEQTEDDLETVLGRVQELLKTYQSFQATVGETLSELNIVQSPRLSSAIATGDLANLVNPQELAENEVREVLDLKRLSQSFVDTIAPLHEISRVLKTQKQLLSDIPNVWPVVGGRSAILMEFGPNRHPITDKWYIHQGIDISGPVGLSVVSSANGKIIEAAYDTLNGYGAYILIEHKYGFRTRYSHLDTFFVRPGDEVYQGQKIGTLGNTGISTRPHVEFQIMLGTQVLDPASFLKLSSEEQWGEGV